MGTDAPSRVDPRRARTRSALIGAARGFLAQGTTNVSIQEITDAADVGFGSFYNHFDSKDELFAEAVAETLEAWGALRDDAVAGLVDPVEIFATSFRMAGRFGRAYPELVRVILHSGASVLVTDRGIRPRALADITAGVEAGRFHVPSPDIALMAAGGALLGLLQLLDSEPLLDAAEASDQFTVHVLLLLGVDLEEATAVVAAPLEETPPLT